MDLIATARVEAALTILAGRGLQVARDADALRSEVRARPYIAEAEVLAEVVRLQREVDAWEGDVRIWRQYLERTRVWWRRWWG